MPREGVPYPERMLCSLKCELKNIWNALSGKLHSVNGVEGDGQGNVTIVSENAALEVHDYPLQNQIGISLDTSQLPAANVDSVNGQTGVVVLNADDIPSDGGSDVQADIDALKLADTTLQGNITAEATARGNTDTVLQNNINAEALTRSSDDTALQNQINALPTFSDVSDALDNYAPMLRTTGNQAAAGTKYINAVTYVGNMAPSTGTEYSLIADLGPVGNANMIVMAVSRGGASIGAISVSGTGVPTWQGIGIAASTSLGIAIKDGNMYLAGKRTGSSGQSYTISILGVTKGTTHLTIVPYEGNAPVEDVDSYTEAVMI